MLVDKFSNVLGDRVLQSPVVSTSGFKSRLYCDGMDGGEDLLDIRIDFFVLNHNRKLDARLGRVDRVTLGLPHEMAFLNQVASSVLAADPSTKVAACTYQHAS